MCVWCVCVCGVCGGVCVCGGECVCVCVVCVCVFATSSVVRLSVSVYECVFGTVVSEGFM